MENVVFVLILTVPYKSTRSDINEARNLLMQLPKLGYLYLQMHYKIGFGFLSKRLLITKYHFCRYIYDQATVFYPTLFYTIFSKVSVRCN